MEEQEDIKKAKEALVQLMMPAAFVSLDVFHCHVQPGELLAVFSHNLKKLLGYAMPDLEAAAREQLLYHEEVDRQLEEIRQLGMITESNSP